MVGSVVVQSVEGFQPSYALGPVTAHFWGLHQDPDPDINPKEKDMNKVLFGSLLRAHYDPAGLSSKHAQKAEVLPGLSHRIRC